MQPTYIPWIGYFDLIRQADIFVFLTDVQFSKQGWQVRNKIKSQQLELTLTLPVKKAPLETLLNKIVIDNTKLWKKNHLKTIYYNYSKSKYFNEVFPFLEELYSFKTDSLSEFNMHLIKEIARKIGLKTIFIDSNLLNIDPKDKLDRIIKICQVVEASDYISTSGSLSYLVSMNYLKIFDEASIFFKINKYNPAVYPQLKNPFIPYLSIIDLIFNVGFIQSNNFIKSYNENKFQPTQ
jgi:hypothetical protein